VQQRRRRGERYGDDDVEHDGRCDDEHDGRCDDVEHVERGHDVGERDGGYVERLDERVDGARV
jgi:hypothetical protein